MLVVEYISSLLLKYEIDTIFGIVGIPVVDLADCFIQHGIKFIAFRNEQSAAYAASSYYFHTKKPGVLLTVGSTGLLHSLAGLLNSIENEWPLIVLTGSIDTEHAYKKDFQELDHISLLHRHVAFTGQIDPNNIDRVMYEAYRHSILEKSVSFVNLPANVITGETDLSLPSDEDLAVTQIEECCQFVPNDAQLRKVAQLLMTSIADGNKTILVVIGNNAVHASDELREFVNTFKLPFLPTSMAKGVVEDSSRLNVSSARSMALKTANLVILVGTNLNWMLHFGEAGKLKKDCQFVQLDQTATNVGLNNFKFVNYSLIGDIKLSIPKLNFAMTQFSTFASYKGISNEMKAKIKSNEQNLRLKEAQPFQKLLNYNQVYGLLKKNINDKETIIISEGANTMDISRISFQTDYPKHRLDCGNLATMGIGLGYAITSCLANKDKTTLLIQGDSAFGFSGMELETIARQRLGLIIVLMNNSGIYHGTLDPNQKNSTMLTKNCRYDLMAQGLGCEGYLIETLEQLQVHTKLALQNAKRNKCTLLNVIIEPGKQGKLSFNWQNKSRL